MKEFEEAIKNENTTREDMAKVYRKLIDSSLNSKTVKVGDFNQMIINRWSKSGLEYIKKLAWEEL